MVYIAENYQTSKFHGSEADVHVWLFRLWPGFVDVASLDEEERRRADRFHFQAHRDRFIAVRWLLRRLLGCWLGQHPSQVKLGYGPHGKPYLMSEQSRYFNVSHSEDIAVIALSEVVPVGVDVERVRDLPDMDSLARTIFNAEENAQLRERDGQINIHRFFAGWTRKEAVLKAKGTGLFDSLRSVIVDVLEDSPRIRAMVDGDVRQWTLRNLDAGDGYSGAIAAPHPDMMIKLHRSLPNEPSGIPDS